MSGVEKSVVNFSQFTEEEERRRRRKKKKKKEKTKF